MARKKKVAEMLPNPFDDVMTMEEMICGPKPKEEPVTFDIESLGSCNEMMKYNMDDAFPSFHSKCKGDAIKFYPGYYGYLSRVGGIFNKKAGSPIFTLTEMNEQPHADVEFFIWALKEPGPKNLVYFYRNFIYHIHKLTRGLFKDYEPTLKL